MASLMNFANPSSVAERAAAWVGSDGNIWANLGGSVQNLGAANGVQNDRTGTLGVDTGSRQFLINWIADPNPGGNATGGSGGSGGSSSGSSAVAFDPSWYLSLIDILGQRKNQDEQAIRNSYATSLNTLAGQRDIALDNLNNEETKLNSQRARGLESLTNDLSKLWQSTNLQLGMFGAGNSSAARDLGMGVTDMANKESQNLNADYNEQLGDIGQTRVGYNKEYENKEKELSSKLNDAILQNANSYQSQIDSLRGDIANKTDSRAVREGQIAALTDSYKNYLAPNEQLNLPEYKGDGVKNSGIGSSVEIQSPNAPQAQYFSVRSTKREDDDNKLY